MGCVGLMGFALIFCCGICGFDGGVDGGGGDGFTVVEVAMV